MSQYTRISSTNEQESAIQKIEKWVKQAGLHLCGGTTIGKHPQTVILDLTHHGAEIYVDDDGEIKVNGELVENYEHFKRRAAIFDLRELQ